MTQPVSTNSDGRQGRSLSSGPEMEDVLTEPQLDKLHELQKALDQERRKNTQLRAQVERLKLAQVEMQSQVEQEEECITNKLMKKLQRLQDEKEQLMREVDREEEFLTNTLQKKLNELKKEKVDLESTLEIEQEYIVNKLRKQIAAVTHEKKELESKLASTSSELIQKLHDSVQRLQSEQISHNAPALFAELSEQIKALHSVQMQYRIDQERYQAKNKQLQKQLCKQENENFLLNQRIIREQERMQELCRQKATLQAEAEISHERQMNVERTLQSSSSTAPSTSRMLLSSPRSSTSKAQTERRVRSCGRSSELLSPLNRLSNSPSPRQQRQQPPQSHEPDSSVVDRTMQRSQSSFLSR